MDEQGNVICAEDNDTDTLYSAGLGLTLSDETFSVNAAAVQMRVTGTCPEDAYMFGVNPDGTVNCRIDQNTQATYDGEDFAKSSPS